MVSSCYGKPGDWRVAGGGGYIVPDIVARVVCSYVVLLLGK